MHRRRQAHDRSPHAALREGQRQVLRSDARVSALLPFIVLRARATANAVREQHRARSVHERLSRVRERFTDRLDGTKIGRHRPHEVTAEQGEVVLEREVNHAVGVPRRLSQPIEIVEGAAPRLRPGRCDGFGRRLGAREADHLVARGQQIADDGETNVTGRAGDEDTHGNPPDVGR
jgi:hypothetical protein